MLGLLKRPPVRVGLIAAFLFFGGEVGGFTFMRPYLEANAALDPTAIAAALLIATQRTPRAEHQTQASTARRELPRRWTKAP